MSLLERRRKKFYAEDISFQDNAISFKNVFHTKDNGHLFNNQEKEFIGRAQVLV